jgi:hypothetical protein
MPAVGCVACGAPATLVTSAWGARQKYCVACAELATDCIRCGEAPNDAGKCRCKGGEPTLPRFEPLR